MKKILIFLILSIYLISFVSAVCTVTLDKTSYVQGETASADMFCTLATEKSKDYVVNWTYENGTQLEIDTGTTPATIGEHFYQTYIISSTHPAGVYFNATLSDGILDGMDSANVTAGSPSSLIITGTTVGGGWMGLASSFKATIKDENEKAITGAQCNIDIKDNSNINTLMDLQVKSIAGKIDHHWVLYYDQFKEATDYVVHINCYCGLNGTTDACIDEDGNIVTNSVGEASFPFTTNTWVTFNEDPLPIIYSNGTDYPNPVVYAGFDRIHWHINASNNYGQVLKTTVSTYLINNETGKIYGNVNEGIGNVPERTFTTGNSTAIFDHLVSQTTPTGIYYIRSFFDVFYKGQLVANYIKDTETFNVTSLEDTYTNHNVEARTFDLAVVNTSTVTQGLTVTPIDGSVTYLTSGELGEFCINATNNYPGDIYTELSEMNLYNPTTGHTFDLSAKATARAQEKAIGTSWLCYSIQIPKEVEEHSDWQFHYTVRIGEYDNIFNCGNECNFELDTEYFWIREEAGRFEVISDVNNPAIRYFGNWRFFEETINNIARDYFTINVNITELHEYDVDPNNKIVDDAWDLYVIYTSNMPCTTELYNYSVLLANGSATNKNVMAKELQWFTNGNLIQRCAVGIEDINLSDIDDDYFEIQVWYDNYEERQTEALEGIENKTGTFHLSVDCPSTGIIGSDIDCTITAYIEDSQMVQKEVDFTCYISDGTSQYSSINFNQMITKNALSMRKSFAVPSKFISEQQYVLQCHADYYNLGSRRDSFYDTFTASTSRRIGGGAGITGEVVGEEEEKEGEEEGPTINWVFMFIILLIITGIIFWLILKRKSKKSFASAQKQREYIPVKITWSKIRNELIEKIKIPAITIFGIFLSGAILFCIYSFLKNSTISGKIISADIATKSSFSQDPLFRGIILTAFIVLMAIILFKSFNLRGEIKFGQNYSVRKFYEDKKSAKLQQRLNQIMLKKEIKKEITKKDYNIRKMTPTEFREFVKRKRSQE